MMELYRRLIEAKKSNLNYKHQHFIPASSISALVTSESVQSALSAYGIRLSTQKLKLIASEAPRIFVILLLLEQLNSIEEFLDSGILDKDIITFGGQTMPDFSTEACKTAFLNLQREVPPVFDCSTTLHISDQIVLPFLYKSDPVCGSFGAVFKVEVACGHLPDFDQKFVAVKQVHMSASNPWDVILREVETLRERKHAHIVPLLASFTTHGIESGYTTRSLCMIFPFADMNMEEWLRLPHRPQYLASRTWQEVRAYLYRCMYELVSALSYLHRELNGMATAHHDIKPKNILLLGEKLKICDLGKSQLVSLDQGSETDGAKGTFTYQPPEYYNEDGSRSTDRQGRQFDMWSIGCILLEVATIIAYGWEGEHVLAFRKQRIESPQRKQIKHYKSVDDDSFHNHIHKVNEWEQQLRDDDGSLRLEKCLNIVNGMMEMVPDDRIYSWEAELDFFELLYPDQSKATRLKKSILCVQPPKTGINIREGKTPLGRAIIYGNVERQNQLTAVGWTATPTATPGQLSKTKHGTNSDQAHYNGRYEPQSENRFTTASTESVDTTSTSDLLSRECLNAATNGEWTIVDSMLARLMSSGAAFATLQNSHGHTILHLAIRGNRFTIVEALLERANSIKLLRAMDKLGMTALHHACMQSTEPILSAVVNTYRAHQDTRLIWVRDCNGRTPLHLAAIQGNSHAAHMLLEIDTALFSPVSTAHLLVCERTPLFDTIHCMVIWQDDNGYTASDLARMHGRHEVLQLIRRFELCPDS